MLWSCGSQLGLVFCVVELWKSVRVGVLCCGVVEVS